jgi:hypothetical protein
MARERRSKLEIYSVGIVTEDKARDSDILKVSPTEDLPYLAGSLNDYKETYEARLPSVAGVQQKDSVEAEATVEARWLGLACGNRNSSPDIRKNETVLLYRYADTEVYFWEKIGREPELRRQEAVTYVFGNEKKYGVPLTRDNSYWVEVNTYDKIVTLHTATNDGEPVGYDCTFDTQKGTFELKDNAGNTLLLNSQDGVFHLTGKKLIFDGEKVELNAKLRVEDQAVFEDKVITQGDIVTQADVTATGTVTGQTAVRWGGTQLVD